MVHPTCHAAIWAAACRIPCAKDRIPTHNTLIGPAHCSSVTLPSAHHPMCIPNGASNTWPYSTPRTLLVLHAANETSLNVEATYRPICGMLSCINPSPTPCGHLNTRPKHTQYRHGQLTLHDENNPIQPPLSAPRCQYITRPRVFPGLHQDLQDKWPHSTTNAMMLCLQLKAQSTSHNPSNNPPCTSTARSLATQQTWSHVVYVSTHQHNNHGALGSAVMQLADRFSCTCGLVLVAAARSDTWRTPLRLSQAHLTHVTT